jgi:CheY-like chemotaxis protein
VLKNAVEASPDGGTVRLEFTASGAGVDLRIRNDGEVPEGIRDRFFEKYATSGKIGGFGLGTYSARLMARVQQGEIELRSSAEEGTTVTVRLSLATDLALAPETPRAARRVLVVDDDEFNRTVLRRSLPTPPFEVETVVNGRAALEAARRAWPEAVLLDLEMPVMDGYEAARRLREIERTEGRSRLTIVAISSNDDHAVVQRALAAGCDHYMVKPAERNALLQLLKK